MQKEFKEIIFDFAKAISDFDSVKAVVLFGSVAKGEADKRSDIDALVVFKTAEETFKDEDVIFDISQRLGKKYGKQVQLVFSNKNFKGLDRKFIETILKEGIIIYGSLPSLRANDILLEPYLIINFELSKLNKKKRNKLSTALRGYKTKKKLKSKLYKSSSEGLIKKYDAAKLGPSSIIVPYDNASVFETLFRRYNVKFKKTDIWIPLP